MNGGKVEDPIVASRISLYILASQLHISPAEAYDMHYSQVRDLLLIHSIVKDMEAKAMDKKVKQHGGPRANA